MLRDPSQSGAEPSCQRPLLSPPPFINYGNGRASAALVGPADRLSRTLVAVSFYLRERVRETETVGTVADRRGQHCINGGAWRAIRPWPEPKVTDSTRPKNIALRCSFKLLTMPCIAIKKKLHN